MSSQTEPNTSKAIQIIEKIGQKIPDPIIIFIWFLALAFILTIFIGGLEFKTTGADGSVIIHTIKNMSEAQNIQWMFDYALLQN